MEETHNQEPFSQIPHLIRSDFRNGKMGCNEYFLCLHLYVIADPYGKAVTSVEAVRSDIFPKLKKNTVNKTLLRLRNKRYIYYKMRQGHTGSFEIHLDKLRLPKGGYKTLDKYFAEEMSAATDGQRLSSAEASQKSIDQNQKSSEEKRQLNEAVFTDFSPREIRSYQNDNDIKTKNKNKTDNGSFYKTFNKTLTLVSDFQPTSHQESLCKEIAQKVGEKYINPLLNILCKYEQRGFNAIEKAWGLYREDLQRGKHIEKPPAYFYKMVKEQLIL